MLSRDSSVFEAIWRAAAAASCHRRWGRARREKNSSTWRTAKWRVWGERLKADETSINHSIRTWRLS